MESPIITHKKLQDIDNIENYAYERLYENYLKYDLQGDEKKIEIDSTDLESIIKDQKTKLPIPGMVYTFFHLNDKAMAMLRNEKTGEEFQFHDIIPILFCTFYHPNTKTVGGINMNLLPKVERLKFFSAYYERYKDFFIDIERLVENDKIALNQKYINLAFSGKGQGMINAFNKSQRSLFDYGYRSYKIENIRKLRMIEFEEWKYIPYFVPAQAFRKINLNTIYSMYWDNKNKTI